MKIVIVSRIYVALADSIITKEWHPEGMPAYYKLLEFLDKRSGIETAAICLGKRDHAIIDKKDIFRFPNMRIMFYVIPYRQIFSAKNRGLAVFRRANDIMSDICQFFYCAELILKNNYDIVYMDREHIVFGAIFAVFFRKKVVVRFLGVGSLIKRAGSLRNIAKEPFRFFSYRAPFAYIICSRDGSGSKYFLEKYTNKRTPHEILFNGVDAVDEIHLDRKKKNDSLRLKYGIPDGRKIILFLTRLSPDKGPDLFIKSLARLCRKNKNFFALIVGEGPLRKELEEETARSGLSDNVKFEGGVEHDSIYDYFRQADIYVSLNLLGNLCNTVLEAMNAGKCIVTFKEDKIDHTDEDTVGVLSGAAAFIDKRRAVEELPVVLNMLLNNEKKIKKLSLEAKRLAGNILPDWEERIDYEIALLQKLAKEDGK